MAVRKLLGLILTILPTVLLSSCGYMKSTAEDINPMPLFSKIDLVAVGGSVSITEGQSFALSLSFSASLPSNESLNYTITSSRNDVAADFVVSQGILIIASGASSANLIVQSQNDNIYEGSENFTLTFSTSSAVIDLRSNASITLTVLDNDAAPMMSLSSATANVAENAGSLSLAVNLDRPSAFAITVPYSVSFSTASAADIGTSSGTLTFAAGETIKNISLSIIDDALIETSETLDLNLGAVTGVATLGQSTTSITITDDDFLIPTLAIDSVAIAEGTGAGTTTMIFTVTLSATSPQALTVNYATSAATATSGVDFTSASSTLTFAAGQTTKTIGVVIARDALDEADETFSLTLSGGANYTVAGSTLIGTGTVTDDDAAPTVEWTTSTSSSVESSATLVNVTAQLSAVSGRDVTVPFTLGGTATDFVDFTSTLSPIIIPAGSTTVAVAITHIDDSVVESDETVTLTMGSPTFATASGTTLHTHTIVNDDMGSFAISGVRSAGGLDIITDTYLNYEAAPRFLFGASTSATSYDVTVYENDGTTVACSTQNTVALSFDPSACNLTAGNSYKLLVTAKLNTFTQNASNAPFSFTFNRGPILPNRGIWNVAMNSNRTQNVILDDPATGANDPATDADGDSLSVTAVSTATYGTTSFSGQSVTYTASTTYDGPDSFTVTITDGRGAITSATVSIDSVSGYRWTGASGVNTNWSTANNWCGSLNASYNCSGGSAPGSSNIAVFNSRCTNCSPTITSAVNVAGINMQSDYTGTITQNTGNTMTIGTSGWSISGGTFSGTTGTGDITVRGNFALAAGATFTSTRTNLNLSKTTTGCGTVDASYSLLGSFNHNNGTVVFGSTTAGNGGCYGGLLVSSLDVNSGNTTFYNMTVDIYNTGGYPYIPSLKITDAADILNVTNDFRMTSGLLNQGTINISGNIYSSAANSARWAVGGSTELVLVGAASTTYTVSNNTYAAPVLPYIKINKNSNAVTVSSSDNKDIYLSGLTLTSGDFRAPSGTLTLGNQTSVGSFFPTILKTSGGLFSHNSGTVHFLGYANYSGSNTIFDYADAYNVVASGISLNNLNVTAYGTSTRKVGGISFVGSDFSILGNLTINSGLFHDGDIRLHGNLIANCANSTAGQCAYRHRRYTGTYSANPTNIIFSGSAAQTYTFAAGAGTAALTIDKTNATDTVTPTVGSPLNITFLTVHKGALTLSPNTTSIGLNYGSTTYYETRGLAITGMAADVAINHNNGTLVFDAQNTGGIYTRMMSGISLGGVPLNLNHLTVNISAGPEAFVYFNSATDVITVAGNFTVDSGGIVQNGSTLPTVNQLQIYGNVAFNCVSATVCSKIQTVGGYYGIRASLMGGSKTISQASGAAFGFRRMEINLDDNTKTFTLQTSLSSVLNSTATPWTDVYHKIGVVTKNGFTYSGINALNVTAGATCSGPLGYTSITGTGGCQ